MVLAFGGNCECIVISMHITASVFIKHDEQVSQHRHNDTGEDNADAHIKRQIVEREVVVAATAGRLDFGTWEQIFCGEFDGRRQKIAQNAPASLF